MPDVVKGTAVQNYLPVEVASGLEHKSVGWGLVAHKTSD